MRRAEWWGLAYELGYVYSELRNVGMLSQYVVELRLAALMRNVNMRERSATCEQRAEKRRRDCAVVEMNSGQVGEAR